MSGDFGLWILDFGFSRPGGVEASGAIGTGIGPSAGRASPARTGVAPSAGAASPFGTGLAPSAGAPSLVGTGLAPSAASPRSQSPRTGTAASPVGTGLAPSGTPAATDDRGVGTLLASSENREDDTLEFERYELREEGRALEITRRELLGAAAGLAGLLVICLLPGVAEAQESGGGGRRRGAFGGGPMPQDIGAWLLVGEDGRITGFTGKVEIGQNARTSLTQVIAEELRVPLASVDVVMGDTARVPYDMGTFGSRTTPTMAPQIRRAAAAAREALIDLAADQWKVDRAGLHADAGGVTDPASGRSAGYGELSKGQKLTRTIAADAHITPVTEWKVEGTSARKPEGRAIVTGRHQYPSDIKRPGMLYGKVVRPDRFGAKLVSAETAAAEHMPGVKVVRASSASSVRDRPDGAIDFLGIAAPSAPEAATAAEAIVAQWSSPMERGPSSETVYDYLKQHPAGEGRTGGDSGGDNANVSRALAAAELKLQATYTVAYIAHAPLEPRAAVAEWEGDHLTVWTGTQRPFGVRDELAQAFGVPTSQVHVIMPDMGSGYGGKHTGECAIEAARLAKAAGKPVKLVWTRQEEMTWAYFRPCGVIDVQSGASRDGTLTAWDFRNYNSGPSGVQTPYDVADQRCTFHPTEYPLRQGSYRGLAATANHFAREVHMDELAHAVKLDPVAFRMKNLKDDRIRAVLQAATERFGWDRYSRSPLPPGAGIGVACGTEKGGYIATCAEVSVEPRTHQVRVRRVVEAFECGAVINPDGLRNQIEGAIMMALGGALYEQIEFADGKVTNPFFSKYRTPRFADMPEIDVVLVDRKDLPSAGAGETPIVGLAPAVSNALFMATGTRYRSMPMCPRGAVSG